MEDPRRSAGLPEPKPYLYGGIALLLAVAGMTLAIVISIILLRRFRADRSD